MAAPLPVFVARDPLSDPRGRARLLLVLPLPSTVPGDIYAVAPDVAGAMLGCVRGRGECPDAVASLFPATQEFPVATETAPPGSVCSLTPGSPSDTGAAPFGGVTPAAKGSLSRSGTVFSAVILAAARVALGMSPGAGQGSLHLGILVSDYGDILRGYIISTSWLRLPPNPRVTFRCRNCSFR